MTPCVDGCVQVALPSGWGRATLHDAVHLPSDSSTHRSYDGLGRQLVWRPPSQGRHACDLEARSASAPTLARRFCTGDDELSLRWVVTETLAKLTHTPVLAYLRDHGLAEAAGGAVGRVLRYRGGTVEVLVQRVPTGRGEAFAAFGRVPTPVGRG